jgi:hypothetical protein
MREAGEATRRRLFVTEKLYYDLASWWPVISPPSMYAEEAKVYVEMIRSAVSGPVRRVLELGRGGGNNASHMNQAFEMTLVEPAERMRQNSRKPNPECEHISGDMRSVRLGRAFDYSREPRQKIGHAAKSPIPKRGPHGLTPHCNSL